MRNNKGIVAQMHSSATQWRHVFNLEITLKKGSLILGGLLTNSKSYGNETLRIITPEAKDQGNPKEELREYKLDNSWKEEVFYFSDCLKNSKDIKKGTIKDALETLNLVEKIYMSDASWKDRFYK